jgi:hypothetical protein
MAIQFKSSTASAWDVESVLKIATTNASHSATALLACAEFAVGIGADDDQRQRVRDAAGQLITSIAKEKVSSMESMGMIGRALILLG